MVQQRCPASASTCRGLVSYSHLVSDKDLAVILQRLLQAGYPLTGASDHGVSEAIYLNDPDENGVELYWDRPKEQWPMKGDGSLDMYTRRLDLDDLLKETKR